MADCASIILFSGNLACCRVAKVSVCPQALQALREQCLAFSHEKSQDLHEKAGWPRDDEPQVFPFVLFQMVALLFCLSTVSTTKVLCNPGAFHTSFLVCLLTWKTSAVLVWSQKARCDCIQRMLHCYNEVSIFFPFFRTVPLKKH